MTLRYPVQCTSLHKTVAFHAATNTIRVKENRGLQEQARAMANLAKTKNMPKQKSTVRIVKLQSFKLENYGNCIYMSSDALRRWPCFFPVK